jgi:dihydroxyacid dehydratase/phosphogluconate dehydratase
MLLFTCSPSRRVEVELTLGDWDRLGRDVPTIVDHMPWDFLMRISISWRPTGRDSDAGGHELIHRGAMTVNGQTIWENCKTAPIYNRKSSPWKGPW